MSEPETRYHIGANRYHSLPERTEEQVDAAYHAAMTSPAGQIVMDDLYKAVCFTARPPDEQFLEPGIKAMWIHILERLYAHEARGRAFERNDNGR